MSKNSLAIFPFITWHNPNDPGGMPALLRQSSRIIQSPGFDGTTVFNEGVKAPLCEMISGTDLPTIGDASIIMANYTFLIGTGKKKIWWADQDFSITYGVAYIVIEVECLRIRRLSASVGGFFPNAGAWLEARWTLQPVFP